jgi:hypothetical protein
MKRLSSDKIIILIILSIVLLFFSISYLQITGYLRPYNCSDRAQIVLRFYPNITSSEAHSIVNSTGGKMLKEKEYVFNSSSDEKAILIIIEVPSDKAQEYANIYKEKSEVYEVHVEYPIC